MNIKAFIKDLNHLGRYGLVKDVAGGPDMYSGKIADIMLKHGLLVCRAATPEDCDLGWCKRRNVQPGNLVYVDSDRLRSYLDEGA